jgi:predicted extracellular nuclease
MKTIDLTNNTSTITEILALAGEETVIIKTIDGKEFVVAEIDDFSQEIELVSQNEELMNFLKQRSQETKRYSLSQVKELLNNQ